MALVNDNIDLTEGEWSGLVLSSVYPPAPDGPVGFYRPRFTSIMRRGRMAVQHKASDPLRLVEIADEARRFKDDFQSVIARCRSPLDQNDIDKPPASDLPYPSAIMHWLNLRSYAFAITAGIMVNCIVTALVGSEQTCSDQSIKFAQEILHLASIVKRYRPVGSMYMLLCLSFAYIATREQAIRSEALGLLEEERMNLPKYRNYSGKTGLLWLEQRFALKETVPFHEMADSLVAAAMSVPFYG